jgi:hypothetical protein
MVGPVDRPRPVHSGRVGATRASVGSRPIPQVERQTIASAHEARSPAGIEESRPRGLEET